MATYSKIRRQKRLDMEVLPQTRSIRNNQDEQARNERGIRRDRLSVTAVRKVVWHIVPASIPSSDKRHIVQCLAVILQTISRQRDHPSHQCQHTNCKIGYTPSTRTPTR